jgi:hypothetical protein
MVGSNRQSWSDDFFANHFHESSEGSGSCFPAYSALRDAIEQEIKKQQKNAVSSVVTTAADVKTSTQESNNIPLPDIEFDAYLMADAYRGQRAGTAVKHAIQFNEFHWDAVEYLDEYRLLLNHPIELSEWLKEKFHDMDAPAHWLFDMTKITLLYVQMQRAANRNPQAQIDFIFLDDSLSILNMLDGFYNKHTDLIPKNLKFNWFWYGEGYVDFNEEFSSSSILGSGKVDTSYEVSLLVWAAILLGINNQNKHGLFQEKSEQVGADAKADGTESVQMKVYKKINSIIYEENKKQEIYRHTEETVQLFKSKKVFNPSVIKEKPKTHNIEIVEIESEIFNFSLG